MIRARKDGMLEFTASHELAVLAIARYLGISIDDLKERIQTPTERQEKRRILTHT